MGYSRRFSSYVLEEGFALDLLDPELSDKQANQLINFDQGRSLHHPFSTKMVRQRVASERALMRSWKPDVVVIGTTLTMFISARAEGIPLVYIRPYAMSKSQLTTMRTFPVIGSTGTISLTVNQISGSILRRLSGIVRWKPRSFKIVSAENGVSLPQLTLDNFEGDLNLIASGFPAIDARPLSQNDRVVGPIYAKSRGELPSVIGTLKQGDRPVIYLGLGSSANRRLAQSLIWQLAPLEIEVVSSAAWYLTDTDRKRLPKNIHLFDFLPAHLLTGLIDASIIHGGEGTIQTACASGSPFAGIGLQPEQIHNITECVEYGNALQFTKKDIRRKRIPSLVNLLLTESQLRAKARRLQSEFGQIDGPGNSVQWIEKIAAAKCVRLSACSPNALKSSCFG